MSSLSKLKVKNDFWKENTFPFERDRTLSCVPLFAILWTVACPTSLSREFSRQENWSGLPFPSPDDLLYSGFEHRSPALQADSLPTVPLIVGWIQFQVNRKTKQKKITLKKGTYPVQNIYPQA